METKDGDDFKNDKRKRILGHNIDKMEKENLPKELKPVFLGSEQEKVKAIKGGKKVLKKNEDLLKPRKGLKPWQKITDMKIQDGKPKIVDKEKVILFFLYYLGALLWLLVQIQKPND